MSDKTQDFPEEWRWLYEEGRKRGQTEAHAVLKIDNMTIKSLHERLASQAAEIKRLKEELGRIQNIGMMFQAAAQPSGPLHSVCKHGYIKACPVCDAAKDHS